MGIIEISPLSGDIIKSNTFIRFMAIEPNRFEVCGDFWQVLVVNGRALTAPRENNSRKNVILS
jgi:hypothetical protein